MVVRYKQTSVNDTTLQHETGGRDDPYVERAKRKQPEPPIYDDPFLEPTSDPIDHAGLPEPKPSPCRTLVRHQRRELGPPIHQSPPQRANTVVFAVSPLAALRADINPLLTCEKGRTAPAQKRRRSGLGVVPRVLLSRDCGRDHFGVGSPPPTPVSEFLRTHYPDEMLKSEVLREYSLKLGGPDLDMSRLLEMPLLLAYPELGPPVMPVHADFGDVHKGILGWNRAKGLPEEFAVRYAKQFTALADQWHPDIPIMEAVQLLVFAFAYDDLTDNPHLSGMGSDPSCIIDFNDHLMAILRGSDLAGVDYKDRMACSVVAMMQDLAEILRIMEKRALDTQYFAAAMLATFRAKAHEATWKREHFVPDLVGYLGNMLDASGRSVGNRIDASGVRVVLELYYLLRGQRVSEEVRSLQHYKTMCNIAAIIISIVNDLISLFKEIKEGVTENVVLVREQELRKDGKPVSREAAIQYAVKIHNTEMKLFIEKMNELLKDSEEYQALVPLLNMIKGHFQWVKAGVERYQQEGAR